MSIEIYTSEKGWLRSELIFNNLIYGDTNGSLTWDIWQKGYDLFLDAIEFGNANECKDCPEELPEGDHEENYKDIIEIHLGDGICSGNEINSIKGIPEDKIYGTVAPEGSIEKKGVEAKDRTFLLSGTRETLKRLVKNRDTITALKIATSSLKKIVKKEAYAEYVYQLLDFIKVECQSINLPIGYYGLFDELSRETSITALFSSHDTDAYLVLNNYLNEK